MSFCFSYLLLRIAAVWRSPAREGTSLLFSLTAECTTYLAGLILAV